MKKYWYAIHHPLGGVVQSWDAAQKAMDLLRATGQGGFRCKKFTSREDAENYARTGSVTPVIDGMTVYTDGSARRIGGHMCAGIGVWFGRDSDMNLSEPLPGPATNNRAELWAIHRALELLEGADVTILSDSTYAQKCLKDWRAAWERTNFRNNTIQNRDIIEPLWTMLDAYPGHVTIKWIKGHVGIPGNEEADALANAGAEAYFRLNFAPVSVAVPESLPEGPRL